MVVFSTGILVATLFTIFTPLGITTGLGFGIDGVFRPVDIEDSSALYPTSTPRPRPKIGIVAGHWGTDTGAVCPDGLAEVDINLDIATRVKQMLVEEGFDVDLLMELDSRLEFYQAISLVSIHADSCAFYGTDATGFKVAATFATARPDRANRLVSCIYSRYSDVTGMAYHAGVTDDMTSYHAFEEIHTDTAAAIIETGFLNLDRQILTQQPDLIAEGIARGILCYIRNEDASPPETN
jgi:N-acetylmuramoyl-L-alanine amidase